MGWVDAGSDRRGEFVHVHGAGQVVEHLVLHRGESKLSARSEWWLRRMVSPRVRVTVNVSPWSKNWGG